jgi:hypothetical protein
MKHLPEDLIITASGAFTSVLTALLLYGVERVFEISIYSWTFLFIIPVGAGISGFAAATGYWFGAKLLNRRPGWILLFSILGVSMGTFFLVHYLNYAALVINGVPVRDAVPFGTYLSIVLTKSAISFHLRTVSLGSTGTLGAWGYVYALLQILGFAIGGFTVYTFLLLQPFCGSCERYYKRMKRTFRFTGDPDLMKGLVATVLPLLYDKRLSEVEAAVESFGKPKPDKADTLRVEVSLWRCKACGERLLRFSVAKRSGDNWTDVDGLTHEAVSGSLVVTASTAA